MKYEKHSYGAFNLHLINTDKFKNINVSVFFRRPIKKEEITIRNLLKTSLLYATNTYKTEKDLSIAFENLYDPSLVSSTFRVGNYLILSYNFSFLNECFTEKNMNNESLDLFMDILFNPLINNNAFDSQIVNICKNKLTKNIETEKDNKSKYTIKKLLENMGDYPYSYNLTGNIDDLEKITPSNLYTYYKDIINNDLIDIFVVGDFDNIQMKEYFKNNFKANVYKKDKIKVCLDDERIKTKINKIILKDDVNQTNLAIGLKINNMTDFERKYVIKIYNEILGGGANSLLFDEVREKNSLAYSIYSFSQPYDNLLVIYSGINKDNSDKAIKIIKKNLKDMEKGNYDKVLFDNAIKAMLNSIKVSSDKAVSIIGSYFAMEIVDADNLEDKIKNYQKVTHNDITNLAKKIKIDTILLLEGEKTNGN